MRLICILPFLVCLTVWADDITPRIGSIEIYGTRKVSLQKIRTALGAKEGDPLPGREDAEDRIDKLSGVLASRVEATCCAGRNMVLYVGVEERDAPHSEFHAPPTGDVKLPPELVNEYRNFLSAVGASLRRGRHPDEDLTNGYSLMADPDARELQQHFLAEISANLPLLDRVIRQAADPEQRSTAAYLLQYAPRGPRTTDVMVGSLQYGLQDNEEAVRENAIRSPRAVAVGAKLHPEQQIHIQPTWFVELLNSLIWSDRYDAALALVNLTDNRNGDTLALIRERALASVLDMANWHDLQHALPAFILAGRLAALDENEIKQAWVNEDRQAVIDQAQAPKKHFRILPKKQG